MSRSGGTKKLGRRHTFNLLDAFSIDDLKPFRVRLLRMEWATRAAFRAVQAPWK
jgi:hypothetical protein